MLTILSYINKISKHIVKELGNGRNIVRYTPYRSMLFTPHNNKVNDLLYNSPKYDMLKLTDKIPEFKTSKIVVKDIYNISRTLMHFGYDQYLKQEDIIQIKKLLFNKTFIANNCNMFGLEEEVKSVNMEGFADIEDIDYCSTLLIEQINYIITKLLDKQRYEMIYSNNTKESYEMIQQWEAILSLSNDRLREFINKGVKIRLDAFKPSKKEGKIKMLK